jgi:Flp pilus assembly protein TadB
MKTSTTVDPDGQATEAPSTPATPSASAPADGERLASRREVVLATALAALIAAVVLFGLAFPALLAPAVAIAVLAAILALDWVLPSGELRRASKRFWKS